MLFCLSVVLLSVLYRLRPRLSLERNGGNGMGLEMGMGVGGLLEGGVDGRDLFRKSQRTTTRYGGTNECFDWMIRSWFYGGSTAESSAYGVRALTMLHSIAVVHESCTARFLFQPLLSRPDLLFPPGASTDALAAIFFFALPALASD